MWGWGGVVYSAVFLVEIKMERELFILNKTTAVRIRHYKTYGMKQNKE